MRQAINFLRYLLLRMRLRVLIYASMELGMREHAKNLCLRKQRVTIKWRGLHCFPVYCQDYGTGQDVFTAWRAEPLEPGYQVKGIYYRHG